MLSWILNEHVITPTYRLIREVGNNCICGNQLLQFLNLFFQQNSYLSLYLPWSGGWCKKIWGITCFGGVVPADRLPAVTRTHHYHVHYPLDVTRCISTKRPPSIYRLLFFLQSIPCGLIKQWACQMNGGTRVSPPSAYAVFGQWSQNICPGTLETVGETPRLNRVMSERPLRRAHQLENGDRTGQPAERDRLLYVSFGMPAVARSNLSKTPAADGGPDRRVQSVLLQ